MDSKNIKYVRSALIGVVVLWLLSLILIPIFGPPTNSGTFGDMFGAVNSLFSGLAFVGIIYTIFIQAEAIKLQSKSVELQMNTVKEDHERRRKEATILYMNQIRPVYRSLLQELESIQGKERLTQSSLKIILNNDSSRNILKEYLATMEHLAVGANVGVFDKDLLFRMSANYLIRTHNKFEPYITEVQKGKNQSSVYEEFEKLAVEFRARKNNLENNSLGDITSNF